MKIFTIGVYDSSEAEFFGKLTHHGITAFCDVRMRRGVRGRKYAFVNSKRLQERLSVMSIQYYHFKELAPTPEVRERQKREDDKKGVAKRKRTSLGDTFISAYNEQVMSGFDGHQFIDEMAKSGHNRVVLFCVEKHAEACHRSLIGNQLVKLGVEIEHL